MIITDDALTKEQWCKLGKIVFGNPVHVQVRKFGNSDAARDYCRKNSGGEGDRVPGTDYFEFGEFRRTEGATGQGERNDASAVYSWMKSNLGKSRHDAMEAFEGTASFHFLATNLRWYASTMHDLEQATLKQSLVDLYEESNLRPWQKRIVHLVSPSATVPTRLIDIVVCTAGNSGKSYLTTYLSLKLGFVALSLGKRDDLLHAFVTSCPSMASVRGVVIDLPMSSEMNGIDARISVWQVAEMLKNRVVTSPKYASATFFLPQMHVVIMTNQPVPAGSFGEGRLRIHNLTNTALGWSIREELR